MATSHELFKLLVERIEKTRKDQEKHFFKHNKCAGTRFRKRLTEISKLCKECRSIIQQEKIENSNN